METTIKILAAIVGILAILQGWQMFAFRRNKKSNGSNSTNPTIYAKQNNILEKLGEISSGISTMNSKLGRMEQRLADIWDKVKT